MHLMRKTLLWKRSRVPLITGRDPNFCTINIHPCVHLGWPMLQTANLNMKLWAKLCTHRVVLENHL